MRSVTVRLDDLRTMILNLGFVGENEHRTFNFDCKKMFGEYPSASVSLTVQPPTGDCYPTTVERNGDLVSWTVTDSDLIEEGCGEVQLTFMVGDVKAKTCIGRTKVERSLGDTGDIPTPIENWIEQAEEVISEAEAATAAAEDAAEHQPIIDDNGYWAVWDADAEEYVATEYKAQGTDGHDGVGIVSIEKTGTSGLVDTYTITFTSGNHVTYTVTNGRDADPTEIIDDNAGSGDTDKVWSADKSHELLTEINSKADELKTQLNDAEVFFKVNSVATEWQQGWWGASTGSYDSAHNNAVCFRNYISAQAIKAVCSSSYKMRLQAWGPSNAYQGVWNGTSFVKSNPQYFQTIFDIADFRRKYPTYQYKLVLFATDGSSNVTTADAVNVYFTYPEISELKSLKNIAEHINLFDFSDTFTFENRTGTTSYNNVYTVDVPNETLKVTDNHTNGARYIVAVGKTLPAGTYTLSCYVEDVDSSGTNKGVVFVNIGDDESASGYKLKTARIGGEDIGEGATSGWVNFTKTLTQPTKFRFMVLSGSATTNGITISNIMLVKGASLPAYEDYDDSITAIDKVARKAVESIDTTEYNYRNFGEKICIDSQGFNVVGAGYSLPSPSTYEATARQDFDIYNGVLFQLMSNNHVVLVDISDGTVLGDYAISSGHGNSCQFAKEKESESDAYPPLYCFDYDSNKVYKNKVTDSGATLEATYVLSGVSGYRFSGGYDSDNNLLVSINYAQNSSTSATDNYMIFAVWDLNDVTDNGNGTYTPTLLKSRQIPFIPTIQGCTVFKNRLYAISGYYTTYGYPVKLYVFDYDGICTSIIDDFSTAIKHSEGESICFYKVGNEYQCWFATYNLYRLNFEK